MRTIILSIPFLLGSSALLGQTPCGQAVEALFAPTVQGMVVHFNNDSQNNTADSVYFYWSFGDDSVSTEPTPDHTYPGPGVYTVCLYAIVGNCTDTLCQSLELLPGTDPCDSLSASFWHASNGQNNSIFYSASNGFGPHWIWSFGDGTYSDDGPQGTHTYPGPGQYELCLTTWTWLPGAQDTCALSSCQQVFIEGLGSPCDSLNAGFTASVDGSTASFQNAITSLNFSYYWTFGDGSSAYGPNPVHEYPGPGAYTACLLMWAWDQQTQDTCFADHCYSIVIPGGGDPCDSLSAGFWFDDNGQANGIFYSTTSPVAEHWFWSFGDGTYSDNWPQGTHTYPGPGTYELCLTVWNWIPGTQDTCSVSSCQSVFISPGSSCDSLNALFSVSAVASNVHFENALSSINFGYHWYFGDGSQGYGPDPVHLYPGPGNYHACLVMWGWNPDTQDSCFAEHCEWVTIGGDPCDSLIACFTSNILEQGHLAFANCSLIPGPGAQYSWHFGDGATSSEPSPDHTFATPGTYTVCLTVQWEGCVQEVCHPIGIGGGTPCTQLQAAFSWNALQNAVQFGNNTAGTGFSTSWYWQFGDGAFGENAQPTHAYPGPGNYVVCLTAVSMYEWNGDVITCADTICQEVALVAGSSPCEDLSADFSAQPSGLSVALQSTTVSGSWSYHWFFGDGSQGDGPDPVHFYDEPGSYHVCLIVGTYDPDTQDSCFADHCEWITIADGILCDSLWAPDFEYSHQGNTYVFYNTSGSQGLAVSWTFGDGGAGQGSPFTYVFEEPGAQTACMTLVGVLQGTQDTCTTTTCQVVEVLVGTLESAHQERISVGPVPFDEELMISLSSRPSEMVRLTLRDMAGRLVDDHLVPFGSRLRVHFSGLAPGVYLLNLFLDDQQHAFRVVKH